MFHPVFSPPTRRNNFFSAIWALGQYHDLKLCLDAGVMSSYDGSAQSWLDVSGNGYDFFRGASGASAGDDPTFNGVVGGLSGLEFFSFDGGDYFTYHSANEAWMDNLHKASAKFTLLFIHYVPSLGGFRWLVGDYQNDLAKVGMQIVLVTTDKVRISVSNGSGGAAVLTNDSSFSLAVGWHMTAISIDAAAGYGFSFDNVAYSPFTATYSSPSAGSAAHTLQLGAAGNNAAPLPSASRLAAVAAWEGRALNLAEVTRLYQGIRQRFSL